MTNFIFKSQGTYKKLCLKLEAIQSELRHNRSDVNEILYLLHKAVENATSDSNLQKQVDDYYDPPTHPRDDEDSAQDDKC